MDTIVFFHFCICVYVGVYTNMCMHNCECLWERNQKSVLDFFFPITPDLTICSRISLSTCNSMAWLNSWANELWGSDYLYHPLTASST